MDMSHTGNVKPIKEEAMNKSFPGIRITLFIFTLINLVMGILAFASQDIVARFIALFYGATVQLTPQLTHVIRMFGAMNLSMAFLGAMGIKDPVKNIVVIDVAIALLVIRGCEMLVYIKDLTQYFGLSQMRVLQNTASFFIMVILLIVFRPKTK